MERAHDPFDLSRFLDAQAPAIDRVREELGQGRKAGHWMWFVFPQIAGLGRSAASKRYAIASLDEAEAYLSHPVLGARLRELTASVLEIGGLSARDVFGTPDDLKFRSSMTLFARAAPGEPLFRRALGKYFGGEEDEATIALLGAGAARHP